MPKKAQNFNFKVGKQVTFSLMVIFLLFTSLETILKLANFSYSRFPKEMKQNFINSYIMWQGKNRTHQKFIPHPVRMWTAKPNIGKINSDGYQGKLLPIKKTLGVKRILFLGDSCTNAGKDHYPEKTIKLLEKLYKIVAEPLIAGVGGYSTYQGYHYFLESINYDPDIVVVYFNWNDHWLTYGEEDNKFKPLNSFDLFVNRWFSKMRVYQWLHYQIYPPKKYTPLASSGPLEKLLGNLRVPPRYYINNIKRIIETALKHQMKIYFIPAPMGTNVTELKKDHLIPTQYITQVHNLYNSILKTIVKRYEQAYLVEFPDIIFDKRLMRNDGIHPNEEGNEIISRQLAKKIAKHSA